MLTRMSANREQALRFSSRDSPHFADAFSTIRNSCYNVIAEVATGANRT
jgi:hypothetical protein